MKASIFLRPLVIADAMTSFQWRNNPEVWKFTPFRPAAPITAEIETKWLRDVLLREDQKRFAICLSTTKRYIGNVQLINIADGAAEFHLFIAERECWGMGIGSQATAMILDYGFNTLHLDKILLDVNPENSGAIAIYKKMGFRETSGEDSFIRMELYRNEDKTLGEAISYTINLKEEAKWRNLIKRALKYDFYHSWTYHSLDNSAGKAVMFVYENGPDFIAIPLIKRNIPDSSYHDMSSVYGYSGPVSNRDFKTLTAEFIEGFKRSFLDFLKAEQVVTVFSRLNPFFDQSGLVGSFGGLVDNGKVVVFDLGLSLETQQLNYHGGVLRKIRKLREKGYYVKEANTDEDIRNFVSIYTLNMLRVDASETYYFDEAYFKALLHTDEFDARLMFVYDKDDYPVCGAVIVLTNGIMQAHLLGTRAAWLADSPAKLLTEEITVLGRKLGAKYYNLGGGLGFKEDSLFLWKANFSSLTFNYQTWRFVADQEAYNALILRQEIEPQTEVDFFPLYRLQANKV
ncbi:Protein N-acetyltransferase, RimJ/RimL family [Pedobacter steynii]|uniref:Protein N-acetyltransferase, RimJ/RimL family n=1 Tax=Pedobacter steynii TaxID=430522 RepID=A0A1G9RBE8_9SPHI|nr:GNAT family N-acetyltransferase [Pedobacter steynii]SDM20629.1 Protein N-acetyltransferase, RimJ/RimL family [Pedobacter steynii]